ncbi:CHAT domain-containing protein [Daldinia vernicosa]|uniref:CHAT domain-containing protein n=1 Tax=Daldinia vernicosa TaxID=114800 RepID=UPI0020087EC3|nr:CHAT domain-containing protein [Daldinia vernicosa]KAI0852643.1 CHAT domain-containing protein [Daldinia vernicosa]
MKLFHLDPEIINDLGDMNNEELLLLSMMHEDTVIDNQVELYIYTSLLLFTRNQSFECLRRAMQLTKQWITALGLFDHDRERRFGILNFLSLRANRLSCTGDYVKHSYTQDVSDLSILDDLDGMIYQAVGVFSRYQQTGILHYLNEAIRMLEQAITVAPRSTALSNLAGMLWDRFRRLESTNDINRAIDVLNMMVDTTPQDDPTLACRLGNLSMMLGRRFDQTDSMDDLRHSINALNMQLESTTPLDHPHRIDCLVRLAARLNQLYEKTDLIEDLNRAIEVSEMTVDIMSENHPDRRPPLRCLGIQLGIRFEQTGSMDDLNRSIDLLNEALNTITSDNPKLHDRFRWTDSMKDLNCAIDILEGALNSITSDHPAYAPALNCLGCCFSERSRRTHSEDDMNRCIDMSSMAVDATHEDSLADLANRMSNLGAALINRYSWTCSMSDLNSALDKLDMATNLVPVGHRAYIDIGNNFADCLGNLDRAVSILTGILYALALRLNDLNHAIDITTAVVDATPHNHPHQAKRLALFGEVLTSRYQQTGSITDLSRSIPEDHPARPQLLDSLAAGLVFRFVQTGSMDDLNRSIELSNIAMNIPIHDQLGRAVLLMNFASRLGRRFERDGSIYDLNHATPLDHRDRASRLGTLAIWLSYRYDRTGSMNDLDRAIEVSKMSIRLTTLGNSLGYRFFKTSNLEYLNGAIDMASKALDVTPQGHSSRTNMAYNLGNWLEHRYDVTESADDLDWRLRSYKEGWDCHAAGARDRVRAAYAAAQVLTVQCKWEESSQLLEEAIHLFPAISPRSLKHTDKQHMLGKDLAGLASLAAAVSLNAGKGVDNALRLLELGRGIIAGLLIDMRTDISDLQQKYPDLADKFSFLRDELNSPAVLPSDDPSTWESKAKQRREADERFNELITKIRANPEFHNFLLPPDRAELISAADPDPIVIVNLSPCRCDAFLIERTQIRVLNLPDLNMLDAKRWVHYLQSPRKTDSSTAKMLEWLWKVVCRPCLDELGYKTPNSGNLPHVWWIPTGLLSRLPLHAAGRQVSGSNETTLDRVMSSYASSIKALVHGRRRRPHDPAKLLSNHALLVAMKQTPGLTTNGFLPFAARETDMLSSLCPSLQLTPVMPVPRKSDVMEHLTKCQIFHFAGHGKSDPSEPSQSCLLLQDWETDPLTVEDLRDRELQKRPPFLSYLSACSTGSNEAEDLADEGIHLVSAFQLAGFRHVVGTLWQVSDSHCVDVARVLYETLRNEGMTDVAVCRGLHRAVKQLRDDEIKMYEKRMRDATVESESDEEASGCFNWVPYIHFGV